MVDVDLGERAYDILIGRGVLALAGAGSPRLRPGARAADRHRQQRRRASSGSRRSERSPQPASTPSRIVVPRGRGDQELSPCSRQVSEALLAARIERSDLVIALGGGVIGDLAGFAAAIVRRGIDFVQVPTTLLAQVDSSVGGKTGINSPHGKNLLGAFHQPVLVLADTDVLDTLPPRAVPRRLCRSRQIRPDRRREFFAWLEANWREIFSGGAAREHAIAVSCRAKAAIVARDERETGERALLNLGHTFGHALEAATGFSDRLFHGEACRSAWCWRRSFPPNSA